MVALYVSSLFLGSALLFILEPMFGKMILPRLGGGPAVWNTCVVFYQATLLAGYVYAHYLSAKLSVRSQVSLHVLLLVLAAAVLPIRSMFLPATAAAGPTPGLFILLLVSVGAPFLVPWKRISWH